MTTLTQELLDTPPRIRGLYPGEPLTENDGDANAASRSGTGAGTGQPLSRLKQMVRRCTNLAELQAVVSSFLMQELQGTLTAWYYPAGNQIGQDAHVDGLSCPADGLSAEMRSRLQHAALKALAVGTVVDSMPVEAAGPGPRVLALPLAAPQGNSLLVVLDSNRSGAHASAENDAVRLAVTMIGLVIEEWCARRDALRAGFDACSVAAMVEIVSHVQGAVDADAACRRLADSLQVHLQASLVFVGLCRDRKQEPQLCAISGQTVFDRRDETARLTDAAFHESLVRGAAAVWPATEILNRHALLAHQQLAEKINCRTLVSMPLTSDDGRHAGGIIAVFGQVSRTGVRSENSAPELIGKHASVSAETATSLPENLSFTQLTGDALRFLRGAAGPLAACLLMAERLSACQWVEWLRHCRSLLTMHKVRNLGTAVVAVTAALMIPLPYSIRCSMELQPTERRYVAAPFGGPLEECLVEPGDIVAADQLLARMDGREVRWELAGVQADLNKATKERNTHLNSHEFGNAAIARHEVQRLQNRTEMLQHRDSSLEIRSPISGIVVSGDHRQAEGVPLEAGQSLFEIAPLEHMIVDVCIPEEDIRHVATGQTVRVWLDAFPEQVLESTLLRIRPRAELRNSENVFVAEAELSGDHLQLRPGMRGTAKVISGRHTLGWNLFHKPLAHLLGWLGW